MITPICNGKLPRLSNEELSKLIKYSHCLDDVIIETNHRNYYLEELIMIWERFYSENEIYNSPLAKALREEE